MYNFLFLLITYIISQSFNNNGKKKFEYDKGLMRRQLIEEGETIQWSKEEEQESKKMSKWNPTKNSGELKAGALCDTDIP
jgi:hypothetical protein